LLILSPDAAASRATRNQLGQAKRANSRVIALIWQTTDLPTLMEAQLREAPRIDFNGQATPARFEELAGLLQGRSSSVSGPTPPAASDVGRSSPGGRAAAVNQPDEVSPVSFGLRITTTLLNGIELDAGDQDFVKDEFGWLFHAADHLLKVQRKQLSAGQPIAYALPLEVIRKPEANNSLLMKVDHPKFAILADNIRFRFQHQLNTELENLKRYLDRRAKYAQEGQDDVGLQEEIIDNEVRILEALRQMADEINEAYGVLISTPVQLIDYLRETPNPVSIGQLIQSTIIPTFELDEADEAFINEELTWLFSAIDHFRQVRLGQLSAAQPIAQPMPPDAERLERADNRLLPQQPTRPYSVLGATLDSSLQILNRKLKILGRRLDQEARRGTGGRDDTYLQKRIQDVRIEVVKSLQQMAKTIDQLYGIYITSPDQLVQALDG
jgi:hypothetical protein